MGSSRDGASSAGVSRKRTGSSSHRDDAKTIGQWRIGRTIGKGSSGEWSVFVADPIASRSDSQGE